MRREQLYLHDIVLAADAIARFLLGQDSESFDNNDQLESAVAFQLMIIGEAVAHLPEELKAKYPSIPWIQITGLRNQVAHQYFGLAWESIWDTASQEVPVLRKQVAEILRAELPES
jgi:uncharacterized protein with HEPN domain